MDKITEIISNDFDIRMEYAVLAYIISVGADEIKQITDKMISEMETEPLMTKAFQDAYIRATRRICKECSVSDIMTYIANMSFDGARKTTAYLSEDDFDTRDSWLTLLDNLNHQLGNDIDDVTGITVQITVLEEDVYIEEDEDND